MLRPWISPNSKSPCNRRRRRPASRRLLEALWHERRGNWDGAHAIAQDIGTPDGSWAYAYLHRREGDRSERRVDRYRQAGKPVAHGSLDEEWRAIVSALLKRR